MMVMDRIIVIYLGSLLRDLEIGGTSLAFFLETPLFVR